LDPEATETVDNDFKLPSHLKPKINLGKKPSSTLYDEVIFLL